MLRPPRSLRWRLLLATLGGAALALLLAGWVLAGLFQDHVTRQFVAGLTLQLDQVTARLELDAQGRPVIDASTLSDPRWSRPNSGLYWQLDRLEPQGLQRGVLRSRSLWDTELQAPQDVLADGQVHVHRLEGPAGVPLLLLERTVRLAGDSTAPWRLLVAADQRETHAAVRAFHQVLALSLAALLVLLVVAAAAQVAVGLAPLRALQQALSDLREGQAARVQGRFPSEVQPLVDDFNSVLDRNAELVARARTQAGNLAHAIKTPLAAMAQAATAHPGGHGADADLATLVQEQVAVARRHVDWHLARARAAAAHGMPGLRAPVQPVLQGLLRVMARVHAERGLDLQADNLPEDLAFAGEAQDLQEMLGNLLDNACQWARSTVRVSAQRTPGAGASPLCIRVEDDGPGIEAAQRQRALTRGTRLDEQMPGSGLGLAIVQELSQLYNGGLVLDRSALGGLKAELKLPAASPPR